MTRYNAANCCHRPRTILQYFSALNRSPRGNFGRNTPIVTSYSLVSLIQMSLSISYLERWCARRVRWCIVPRVTNIVAPVRSMQCNISTNICNMLVTILGICHANLTWFEWYVFVMWLIMRMHPIWALCPVGGAKHPWDGRYAPLEVHVFILILLKRYKY